MKLYDCCYPDCFHCTKEDCTNDGLTTAERKASDEYDIEVIGGRKYGRAAVIWKYEHSEKRKDSHKKYEQSDKGKAAHKRYNNSDKGKAVRERYAQTEKGKETEKRKQQKRIESGKNAERCRRYYQKKKMEKLFSA